MITAAVLAALRETVATAQPHTAAPGPSGTANQTAGRAPIAFSGTDPVLRGAAEWVDVDQAVFRWLSLWCIDGTLAEVVRLDPAVHAETGDTVTVNVTWIVE